VAGSMADVVVSLDPDRIPLTSLDVVNAQVPAVKRAKDVVIEEMEGMVISGLANLVSRHRSRDHPHAPPGRRLIDRVRLQNQPLLSTSLQTAHNLRLLPQLVSNLLADLNDAVETRISKVFDLESLGKEVAQKGEFMIVRNSVAMSHTRVSVEAKRS